MFELDIFQDAKKRSAEDRRQMIDELGGKAEYSDDFLSYGYDYFDNSAVGVGYGGYRYDGRYHDAAARMVEEFRLKPGSSILEIGCAKGYILYEFQRLGMEVTGVDASAYAVSHAKEEVKEGVFLNTNEFLDFSDNQFDFVLAKEVVPHLEQEAALVLIQECMRVCADETKIFLELQCAEDEEGTVLMKTWDTTHQTIQPSHWWIDQLEQLGYRGGYHCKPLF